MRTYKTVISARCREALGDIATEVAQRAIDNSEASPSDRRYFEQRNRLVVVSGDGGHPVETAVQVDRRRYRVDVCLGDEVSSVTEEAKRNASKPFLLSDDQWDAIKAGFERAS